MTRDRHERREPVDRGAFRLGEMIKALREQHGLTQRDLAAIRGIPQSAVAEVELSIKGVAERTLLAYAYALGYEDLLAFLEAGTAALRESSSQQK